MKVFTLVVISVLCVGCAATRERAVAIAVGEVANRKLPLPPNYTVRVHEGFSFTEFEPSFKLWCVDLGVPDRKEPLYSVWVDQRNGNIRTFEKERHH